MRARGRTCVGCRRSARRDELVRLIRAADGTVHLDAAGSAPGRGAYLCRDHACLARARRRLAGALRAEHIDFAEIERGFAAPAATA